MLNYEVCSRKLRNLAAKIFWGRLRDNIYMAWVVTVSLDDSA